MNTGSFSCFVCQSLNFFVFLSLLRRFPQINVGGDSARIPFMEHVMAKVLIDNGSSLNVMPKSTLEKFPFNASHLRPSSMVVRAFDGSRREVRGEIDLPVQIGPHTCQVTFQVMDINPA